MQILRTVESLKNKAHELRLQDKTIGLVPTMGALHQGHKSLIDKAVGDCDVTIVSVFVNPTQFNNATDLATYPRTEEADLRLLEDAGVDYVFIPSVAEVYPEPDTRVFDLGVVAEVMEGKMRPGHFNGVAQIVSKLFAWSQPHRAYFGEKDFQQIAVIKKMVELEGFNLEIVECPINRETSGLARSSRNMRLTQQQRDIAPSIYKILKESLEMKTQGMTPQQVETRVLEKLREIPELDPEYYQIVDSITMQPLVDWENLSSPKAYPVGCIAVYCGPVRLIDNIKYLDLTH